MKTEVRAAYSALERELFAAETDEERARVTELLRLTRVQLADDSASNDRQRFGGQRTLSLDRFAEDGYEAPNEEVPPFAVREEREALETGMSGDRHKLTMEQADAVRAIYQYSYSYRESARRLEVTTPALQRRIKRALAALLRAGIRHDRRIYICDVHTPKPEEAA